METNDHENDTNDAALRWQLRALRRDETPARDLWPQIAQRIAADESPRTPANPPPRARQWLPFALAASLLLAVGGVMHFGRQIAPAPQTASVEVQREAQSMAQRYQAAFAELPPAGADSAYAQALHDLDQSAAQILQAIDRQPDAGFLLQQLHRTYNQRLALTRRAAFT